MKGYSRIQSITRTAAPSQKFTALVLFVFISSVAPFNSLAAARAGDLDPTFGAGGKVTTGFPPSCCDRITSLAIQQDGKLVAGVFDSTFSFAVARYTQNGSLDSTFGSSGRVVTNLNNSRVASVVVQSDGKIIAGGSSHNPNPEAFDFTLVRYKPNGKIDKSFGSSGIVHTSFGFSDGILDLTLQPDGKIIAVGEASVGNGFDTDCALARYNSNGSLDATFGSGGRVLTNFASLDAFLDVVIEPDEKIVAVGSATRIFIQTADFVIARYNSDGSLDSTFGTGGTVVTDFFGSADAAFALALQSDGKYVVAGAATESGSTDQHFALVRYNRDGSLDSTFGSNGKVVTAFGFNDTAHALVIQADNKLIAGGIAATRTPGTSDFADFDFALARYNVDGSLDSTFGSGGKVTTDFLGGSDEAFALLLQSNGKLVAGGKAADTVRFNLGLARYETNVAGPRILGATVRGKKLIVSGENFDSGAHILLDGAQQKTSNDEQNPATIVIGKKAGKRIERGQTVRLQVRNSDGALSAEFVFTRLTEPPTQLSRPMNDFQQLSTNNNPDLGISSWCCELQRRN